jgi:hypothetical protein
MARLARTVVVNVPRHLTQCGEGWRSLPRARGKAGNFPSVPGFRFPGPVEEGCVLTRRIASHPFLSGIIISAVLAGAMLVSEIWFPWIPASLARHEKLVDAVVLTAAFFATYLYAGWRWHRRHGFWTSMSVFLLLHVSGVLAYSIYVHPLILWQWSVLGLFEVGALTSLMIWLPARQARRDHNAK